MSCTKELTIAEEAEVPDLVINWPLSVATRLSPYTWTFGSYAFTPTGTPPYTNWQITSGVLPTGLSMNPATGQITGTPTEWYDPLIYASHDVSGTQRPYPFVVRCRDANGLLAQGSLILPYRMAIRLQGAFTNYPTNTTSPYAENLLLIPCDKVIHITQQIDEDGDSGSIVARIFSYTSELTGVHDTIFVVPKYPYSFGKVAVAPTPALSGTTMRVSHSSGYTFPATPFDATVSDGVTYESITVTSVTIFNAFNFDLVFTRGLTPLAIKNTDLVSCPGWVVGNLNTTIFGGGAVLSDDSGNGFGVFQYDNADIVFSPGQSAAPEFTGSITWISGGPPAPLIHGNSAQSLFTIS